MVARFLSRSLVLLLVFLLLRLVLSSSPPLHSLPLFPFPLLPLFLPPSLSLLPILFTIFTLFLASSFSLVLSPPLLLVTSSLRWLFLLSVYVFVYLFLFPDSLLFLYFLYLEVFVRSSVYVNPSLSSRSSLCIRIYFSISLPLFFFLYFSSFVTSCSPASL